MSLLYKQFLLKVLGTLVKRYNHGIACVDRIIHMIKFNESLAAPVGAGIVVMATECGCSGLIREIVREIIKNEPGEADARNFSSFLESITAIQADLVLPVLDEIADFLENEVRYIFFIHDSDIHVLFYFFSVLCFEKLCDRSYGYCNIESVDWREYFSRKPGTKR